MLVLLFGERSDWINDWNARADGLPKEVSDLMGLLQEPKDMLNPILNARNTAGNDR